jgi:hypothetical protein
MWTGLFDFTQTPKVFRSEVVPNPETGLDHCIDDWSTGGYESADFGFSEYAEQSRYAKSARGSNTPAALLVDEQQIHIDFGSHYDGLSFTRVEKGPQNSDLIAAPRRNHSHPGIVYAGTISPEFSLNRGRDHDLPIEVPQ